MATNILQYTFFTNALIISVLAAIACGITGTYIVVKRMSFLSGSIAHSAFGGLGIAYYAGFHPLLGALAFSVLSAAGIATIRHRAYHRLDTVLSALWAIGMSVGLIFIFLTQGYTSDLFSYLFGNILLTSTTDLLIVAALDLVLIVLVIFFFKGFLAVTFDEEFARVQNMPVFWIYLVLFISFALSIVILVRVIGIILLIALLTLPAATAMMLHKTVKRIIPSAIGIAMTALVAGLVIAYYLDVPAGPIIIFAATGLYIAGVALSGLRDRREEKLSADASVSDSEVCR